MGSDHARSSQGYLDGPLVEQVQKRVPEMRVHQMVTCRGTDRFRIPNRQEEVRDLILRKTVCAHRVSGEVIDVGDPEEWQKQSQARRIGKCGPARISLTIFGSHADQGSLSIAREMEAPSENRMEGLQEKTLVMPSTEAWAPRPIAVSGPAFMALSPQERSDIQRLHQNLGHPNPELFQKFLRERGATDLVLKGVLDYQCPTCAENQGAPLLARPGSIHRELDFNDEVGGDGAWWKNGRGKNFHFTHFIDEGTLFHVGAQMFGYNGQDHVNCCTSILLVNMYTKNGPNFFSGRIFEFL